ncbi:FixH family protein [Aureisphaera galaxeae]|uniref:FixH family protein n=1 Tax=Aureisphaera galaxeae TaxID=1538023 RepID=UPI002350D6E7|nr:FixH family protein [Aureisphaera galaxeae]MDC8005206.1 FixH family protein [Aureisphaera galaxeae]
MKWNWGTGIVLGMMAFIGFILYFVITMTTQKKFDHDLVTEAYYAKEMVYQQEIDAESNLQEFDEVMKGERVTEGWKITFPSEVEPSKVQGTVFLYRPSNQKLDIEFPLVLSSSNLLIPDKFLVDGRWNITIDWKYQGKDYLYKQKITY